MLINSMMKRNKKNRDNIYIYSLLFYKKKILQNKTCFPKTKLETSWRNISFLFEIFLQPLQVNEILHIVKGVMLHNCHFLTIFYPTILVSCNVPSPFPAKYVTMEIDTWRYMKYAFDFIETKIRPFEKKEEARCRLDWEWKHFPQIAYWCWSNNARIPYHNARIPYHTTSFMWMFNPSKISIGASWQQWIKNKSLS